MTPHLSDKGIETLFNDKMGSLVTQDTYENVDLYICYITPNEFQEFFENLSDFPSTHPIFKNEAFVLLIEHLWINQTKNYFLKDFYIFLLFLILVCINLLWIFPERISREDLLKEIPKDNSLDGSNGAQRDTWAGYSLASVVLDLVTIIVIVFFFMLNELKSFLSQSVSGFSNKLKSHFSSFWEWIDLLLIIMGLLSSILDLTYILHPSFYQAEDSLLTIKVLYFIFLLFCWIRILDFARGFKITSALIRLIARVISDMFGFLIVLFITIIGVGLSSTLKFL